MRFGRSFAAIDPPLIRCPEVLDEPKDFEDRPLSPRRTREVGRGRGSGISNLFKRACGRSDAVAVLHMRFEYFPRVIPIKSLAAAYFFLSPRCFSYRCDYRIVPSLFAGYTSVLRCSRGYFVRVRAEEGKDCICSEWL